MKALKYICLFLCVVSVAICILNLVGALTMSEAASRDSASLKDAPPEVKERMGALPAGTSRLASGHMKWAIATLFLAIIFGVTFFLLPISSPSQAEVSATETGTRSIALGVFAVVGVIILIGLAFLAGIVLTVRWMFTHMGP